MSSISPPMNASSSSVIRHSILSFRIQPPPSLLSTILFFPELHLGASKCHPLTLTFVSLHLPCFTWDNMLWAYPFRYKWQTFLPLLDWGYLCHILSGPVAFLFGCCESMMLQWPWSEGCLLRIVFSVSLGLNPIVGSLTYVVILFWSSENPQHCFPKWLCSFTVLPGVSRNSFLSTSLSTLILFII